jgi:hypothetical protein
MPLDMLPLISGGLVFYGVCYMLFRERGKHIDKLLSDIDMRKVAPTEKSFIIGWAFRGRTERQERLAHLFTLFPPLVTVLMFLSVFVTYVIVSAFLEIPTMIGILVVSLLLAFPVYRAVDSFEMYLMTRAAGHVGPRRLSNEDKTRLESAKQTIASTVKYFKNLFLLMVPPLIWAASIKILNKEFFAFPQSISAPISLMLMIFGIVTATFPLGIFTPHGVKGPERTYEVGMPLNELQYGTQAVHDAHIARFTRKLSFVDSSRSEE